MAYTFLQSVNAQLKRNRIIQGDAGELATSTVTSTATGLIATGAFTDGARQNEIDISRQLWNEAIFEIYSLGEFAPEVATATVILVANTREYTMPSDFEKFTGRTDEERVFRAATRTWTVAEYPGGYAKMLADQPGFASQWQGDPLHYAISPVTLGTVRFDSESTATYTLNALYDKRMNLASATDAMPFSDTVTDCLVPVVAEAFNRTWKKEFDAAWFRSSIARALEYAKQTQRRTQWGPRVGR